MGRGSRAELRRIAAAVALVVRDERALVLRRRPDDRSFAHQWCLPGGRIEPGEDAATAAVREAEEETGLVVSVHAALGAREVVLPRRRIELEIHRFVGRTAGGVVVLSDEHVEARWLSRDEAAAAEKILPSGVAGEVTAELLARFSRREL